MFNWNISDRNLPNFYALMSSTNEETIYKNALYVKKTTETLISIYQLTLISLFELIYILVYTCIVFVQVWLFDQNVDIPYTCLVRKSLHINLSLLKRNKLITQLCMYIFIRYINVYVWPVDSISLINLWTWTWFSEQLVLLKNSRYWMHKSI